MAEKFHLTSRDRDVLLATIASVSGRQRIGQVPQRRRRIRGGSGAGAANAVALAQMTVAAHGHEDPDLLDIGKAVLLDPVFLKPLGADGAVLILDPEDPAYDPDLVEAAEFEIKSCHTDSDLNPENRVYVTSTDEVTPGSIWDVTHAYGIHVNGSSYWEGHDSFEENFYLGAEGGKALYREFETGRFDQTFTGEGICNGDGTITITIYPGTGGTEIFVVPPT